MILILTCLFLFRHLGTNAFPIPFTRIEPVDVHISARDNSVDVCPGRSIWDIIWSCLATTLAVTWVSVHPNIPRLEEGDWPIRRRRLFLMLLSLLAPEIMIMWALKQWRGALMIRYLINEARPQSRRPWTMVHAHFLQMGGFKLQTTVQRDNAVAYKWYDYQTSRGGINVWEGVLVYEDFKRLLADGKIDFPDISEEEINDRSKGDALSKGFALLQITWFIIQLITRAHQHLTITKIELTTAALAGLSSVMYFFWWSKPLDVRCPIIIQTKELEDQLAGGKKKKENWVFTEKSFRLRDYLLDQIFKFTREIFESLCQIPQLFFKSICALALHINGSQPLCGPIESTTLESSTQGQPNASNDVATTPLYRVVGWLWSSSTLFISRLFYLPYILMSLPLSLILNPHSGVELEGFEDSRAKMHRQPVLRLLFNEQDMHWILSMMFYSEEAGIRPLLYFSTLAGAVFGAIHCAAWHFVFPSHAEQLLWRTASLTIVEVCFCIIAGRPLYIFASSNIYGTSPGTSRQVLQMFIKLLQIIPSFIYPLARVILLILALLSLRDLPDSAFQSVTWTKFIPHV